ncbi:hypothetical protein [Intrasporangium sp.]|uniref:hypothetical protein n=1 Tax=Intrasporangium sp. TaxID=1925024 RepID=UPI0032221F4C
MIAAVIGATLLAAVLAWALGSIVLRIAGVLLVLMGALTMIVTGDLTTLLIVAIGVLAWLAGHLLHALKHRYWASSLAYRTVQVLTRGRLDPARGWGIPTV